MESNLDFLNDDAEVVAKKLIGWRLYKRESSGQLTGGTIVETEAYNQNDAASHTFNGKTPRNEAMFGPAGHAYVYFTYGMHYCFNITAGPIGVGAGVLIRAIIPEQGLELMHQRRKKTDEKLLSDGPAKICQALNITKSDNGKQLNKSELILKPPIKKFRTKSTTRIGIKKDVHRKWRFLAI